MIQNMSYTQLGKSFLKGMSSDRNSWKKIIDNIIESVQKKCKACKNNSMLENSEVKDFNDYLNDTYDQLCQKCQKIFGICAHNIKILGKIKKVFDKMKLPDIVIRDDPSFIKMRKGKGYTYHKIDECGPTHAHFCKILKFANRIMFSGCLDQCILAIGFLNNQSQLFIHKFDVTDKKFKLRFKNKNSESVEYVIPICIIGNSLYNFILQEPDKIFIKNGTKTTIKKLNKIYFKLTPGDKRLLKTNSPIFEWPNFHNTIDSYNIPLARKLLELFGVPNLDELLAIIINIGDTEISTFLDYCCRKKWLLNTINGDINIIPKLVSNITIRHCISSRFGPVLVLDMIYHDESLHAGLMDLLMIYNRSFHVGLSAHENIMKSIGNSIASGVGEIRNDNISGALYAWGYSMNFGYVVHPNNQMAKAIEDKIDLLFKKYEPFI